MLRPDESEALLNSTARIIRHQAELHGPDALLLRSPSGDQRFVNNIHNGLEVVVQNIKPYAISWMDLSDIMRGICYFCFGRGHGELCAFEVERSGGNRIARGRLKTT